MLTDFGVAKIIDLNISMDQTGLGLGMGTPDYMAPEQWEGKSIDGRVDLYALGVVYYELITGRPPFQADTVPAMLAKVLRDPLPKPSKFQKNIPEHVEKILYKALAKNPKDRYPDLASFANILEKLANEKKTRSILSGWGKKSSFMIISDKNSPTTDSGELNFEENDNPSIADDSKSESPDSIPVKESKNQKNITLKYAGVVVGVMAIVGIGSIIYKNTPDLINEPQKNIPIQTEAPLFIDSFDNPKYDDSFDQERWKCLLCDLRHINQQKGELRLERVNSPGGYGSYLPTINSWKISQIAALQSDLKVSYFRGDSSAEVILQADIINDGINWYTSCNLGGSGDSAYFLCKARSDGIDDYVTKTISTPKGKWVQARIEFDHINSKVRYYLDGLEIGSTNFPSVNHFNTMNLGVSVGAFSNGNNSLVGFVDNVKVFPESQESSESGKVSMAETEIISASTDSKTYLALEDFNSPDIHLPGFSADSNRWNIIKDENGNGVYEVDNSDGSRSTGFSFGEEHWKNYTLEYRVRYLQENGYIGAQIRSNGIDGYVVNGSIKEFYLAYMARTGWDRL